MRDDEVAAQLHAKIADLKVRVARLEVAMERWGAERRRLRGHLVVAFLLCAGSLGLALLPHIKVSLNLPPFVGVVAAFLVVIFLFWLYHSYSSLKVATAGWYETQGYLAESKAAISEATHLLDVYGQMRHAHD